MPRGLVKTPHRRRREAKTDYKKRLKLLKSGKLRFVVRRSANNMQCQLIEYRKEGDIVVASANSKQLDKFGWKGNTGNIPSAYLTGLLCGVGAKGKEAVLDLGLQESVKGSTLYAALQGALDSGMSIEHSEEILPPKEKISGKHIADYATKVKKEKPGNYKKMFSAYLKNQLNPEDLNKHFEEVKTKISGKPSKAEPKSKPVE